MVMVMVMVMVKVRAMGRDMVMAQLHALEKGVFVVGSGWVGIWVWVGVWLWFNCRPCKGRVRSCRARARVGLGLVGLGLHTCTHLHTGHALL